MSIIKIKKVYYFNEQQLVRKEYKLWGIPIIRYTYESNVSGRFNQSPLQEVQSPAHPQIPSQEIVRLETQSAKCAVYESCVPEINRGLFSRQECEYLPYLYSLQRKLKEANVPYLRYKQQLVGLYIESILEGQKKRNQLHEDSNSCDDNPLLQVKEKPISQLD